MNVLFITSSRIGDAVLSTGLLDDIIRKHPEAKITIACGPIAHKLFLGVPNLERIIPLHKQKHHKHWLELWQRTFNHKWDIVVDLRNSAVSRLLLGKKRYIFGRHIDKSLHKVQQNAAVMKLDTNNPPAPKLWFTDEQVSKARSFIPDTQEPVLGVGPTANWIGKTWPAERFIEIVKWMTAKGGFMPDARVAVFAAPGEEEPAYQVLEALPKDKRIDVVAKTDPGAAAASLSLCDFYIGNDSGLMHCAAAAGVPTFGVFGPSYPHLYAPWGAHTSYARTPETFDELIDFEGYDPKTLKHNLMESLMVDVVKDGLSKFFEKCEQAA